MNVHPDFQAWVDNPLTIARYWICLRCCGKHTMEYNECPCGKKATP